MIRKMVLVLLSQVLLIGLVGVPPASAAPDVSSTIVISEFRTTGPNGGNDEFIEIFNLSNASVAIGGWKINGSNASGATSTRATIPSGVVLGSGCRYLFTNSSSSGGPYSGAAAGDQAYTTGITNDGGIALLDATNALIDQVGMSTGSAYKEGTSLTPMSVNQNQSYERLPLAINATDTDNNANDFAFNTGVSNPQNASSSCTPLAVTLAGFSATQQGDAILVTWETASELDNLGFNLYRATSPAGPEVQLNAALIPSQAPGSTTGFLYSWQDQVGLIAGQTYYYWLEDVDLSGATTLHGPVSIDFGAPTAVQVGILTADSPSDPQSIWAALAALVVALLTGMAWQGRPTAQARQA